MGRPSITQPPVPASFIVEAFEVRDGVLIYRERPQRHFPHRVDDHARFNAKHAGKPAGFAGPRGVPIVRFVYDGKTRRIALLKVGWIVSTGAYPRGVVLPRDGDPWNVARDNLQVVPHGLHKPWTTGGGQASSLERKAEVDASLLAAMAEHEGAGLMQLAKLVGIGEGRISTKLGRLASRGLAESPQCVPGRSWALTEAGREIVQGEKPLIDDLDRDILRALARTPMGPVKLARRLEVCPMTIRRRANLLAERGLVIADPRGFFSVTLAGREAIGAEALQPAWLKPEAISVAAARDVRERTYIPEATAATRSHCGRLARAAAKRNRSQPFNGGGLFERMAS